MNTKSIPLHTTTDSTTAETVKATDNNKKHDDSALSAGSFYKDQLTVSS